MLQGINDLHGLSIRTADGHLGAVADLYFDEAHWIVRYLVVDTGKWLPGRRVLISPASAHVIDWAGHTVLLDLTCEQVKNSPDVTTDKPVSRQHEEELSMYYGWPAYWTADPFGLEPPPLPMNLPPLDVKPAAPKGDRHLRSVREVKGYHIEALDGPIGHVSDFVFDDATWEIIFMVVDAGSWLHERLVLLKPAWVSGIAWDERSVSVNISREAVSSSPLFRPVFPIPSEYADQLMSHYRPPAEPRP